MEQFFSALQQFLAATRGIIAVAMVQALVNSQKNVKNESQKLHAFLAHAGIASRRACEQFILDGKVMVNGKIIKNVATRVRPTTDVVTYLGKRIELSTKKFVYYVLHKPAGYVTTNADPDGRKTVLHLVPKTGRVYPVGRLDLDTEGLLLLTNDGEFAYRLSHPKFEYGKTYHVLIEGTPSNTALNTLRDGVPLREGRTHPGEVGIVRHEHGNTWMSLTIHEGRNRQVRRMCAYLNLTVLRLIRVELGPFTLGDLLVGKWREATPEELDKAGVKQ